MARIIRTDKAMEKSTGSGPVVSADGVAAKVVETPKPNIATRLPMVNRNLERILTMPAPPLV